MALQTFSFEVISKITVTLRVEQRAFFFPVFTIQPGKAWKLCFIDKFQSASDTQCTKVTSLPGESLLVPEASGCSDSSEAKTLCALDTSTPGPVRTSVGCRARVSCH